LSSSSVLFLLRLLFFHVSPLHHFILGFLRTYRHYAFHFMFYLMSSSTNVLSSLSCTNSHAFSATSVFMFSFLVLQLSSSPCFSCLCFSHPQFHFWLFL
jgi:hypothetical protein